MRYFFVNQRLRRKSYFHCIAHLKIKFELFHMVVTDLLTSDKSPEGLILSVIKDNPNVSTKQIYNKITKQGISIRYHKVYEKVQDMVKRDVLVKTEKNYALNDVWVKRTTTFMETIQIKQMKNSENGLFFGVNNIQKVELLTFNSFNEYADYIRMVRNRVLNDETNSEKTICWICNHIIISLLNMQERMNTVKKFHKDKIKYYSLVRGNDKLDEFMLDFNKKLGINTMKIGFPDRDRADIAIYGDTLLYAIYPVGVIEAIEEFYRNNNGMSDIAKITTALDEISKVYVVVIREPKLVETYKKFIISQFN
jgi:hypothetical protein